MSSLDQSGSFRAFAPHKSKKFIAVVCASVAGFILSIAPAQAALQVAKGLVNTSVGVQPTSAANKWKLTCDPAQVDPFFDTFIPIAGALDNSFDPTKFTLAVSPTTGTFALGWSVQGIGPFEVTSFDVQMTGGGYYNVTSDSTNPSRDFVTAVGNVSGGETGAVTDIEWQLIPSLKNLALPANQDQDFYQLNLDPIDPELTDPGIVRTYADETSFFTVADTTPGSDTPQITTVFDGQNIIPSTNLPEPTTASLLLIGAVGLLGRRRRTN